MKWTTANLKNPNYTANHEIYVGTQIGSFKKLVPTYEKNPFGQKNLQDLSALDKDWTITSLAFGNVEQTEILIGRKHATVQFYSTINERMEHEINLQAANVVGLARFNEQLVAGFATGQVQCSLMEDGDSVETHTLSAGDDISHLRQCPVQRNLVATGGKGRQNNLKVFDMEAGGGKPTFTSKNVPPDFLQLEVPVWDSDVGFIDTPHTLATCSRTGYVRVYDTRNQRRPVQSYTNEVQLSFSTLAAHGNYIYAGSTMGQLKAFDIRKMKTFVHTYKGFTGAVSDLSLDETGKYLSSASLDRYVRVHDADSTVLLYQCYVKSKATRLLLRTVAESPNKDENSTESENNKSKKQKKKLGKKGKKEQLSDDEEYDELFEKMQTVSDQEEDSSESRDEANNEEDDKGNVEETIEEANNEEDDKDNAEEAVDDEVEKVQPEKSKKFTTVKRKLVTPNDKKKKKKTN